MTLFPQTTFSLERSQWLPAPIDTVFEFFSDAGNLERLTPPLLRFQIVTPHPIAMMAGTRIDYQLRIHGLPIRWRTLISAWDPPHRFVDEQLKGPYRQWIHEHRFESLGGGTLATDRIRYQVPGGRWVHRLLVRRDLDRIFDFRQAVMLDQFGPGQVRDRREITSAYPSLKSG